MLKAEWIDKKLEPQCPSNPAYPNGIDLDLSGGADIGCQINLPYPAKRCGIYIIKCNECGYTCGVTTAGRPDDPKSVIVPCILSKVTKQ